MRSTSFLLLSALVVAPVSARPAATDVEIVASDGVVLKATYTDPGRPGPGVLLLHMCNSDRTAWQGLARELAQRGMHSLALDYRGYGESGGERFVDDPQRQQALITEKWADDIDAAFDRLRSRPDVDAERLAAGGGSCGVSHSINLAARHPGEVKTLVLLAGSTTPGGERYLAESPWLPVLASASLDDGQAVELTRWTMEFSGHEHNRFLEYSTGGHGTEMFAVHEGLEGEIADWFARHLVEQPVQVPAKVTPRAGPSARLAGQLNAPGGARRLLDELRAAGEGGRRPQLPPEAAINNAGYGRINEGDPAGAIEIFELHVAAFPHSANALDSLGDAYLAAGDLERAAELARRAIAAIPGDESLTDDFAEAVRQSAEAKLARAAESE